MKASARRGLRAATIGRAREFERRHWAVLPLYWFAALVQLAGLALLGDPALVLSSALFLGMAGLLTWARVERTRGGPRA